MEPSERWVSDLENEQIPPDLLELFERESSSLSFRWSQIFNKTAQFRKSTFSPKMTKSIQVCLLFRSLKKVDFEFGKSSNDLEIESIFTFRECVEIKVNS